ncbi:MAG TPA: rhodanese-like domain-containing protein [Cryomorphaceae bacterium]|nr:rhodanese-like domain-containing protein [Cryomorphaceae bacterium]
MSQISVQELKTLLDKGEDVQVIDIREIHEVDSGSIGGKHIPMASLIERFAEIRRDVPVVIHCKSGSRASAMVHMLRTEKAFDNVVLLEGGIEAWAREIDPTVIVY